MAKAVLSGGLIPRRQSFRKPIFCQHHMLVMSLHPKSHTVNTGDDGS